MAPCPSPTNCATADTMVRSVDALSNLPVETLFLLLSYARPFEDIHRFEWVGAMRSVCKAFRKYVLDAVPASPFALERYEYYFHYHEAEMHLVSERDCRLSILPALAKHSWMLALITDLDVYYPVDPSDPPKALPIVVKALRTLLTTPNSFPNARQVRIKGIRFINGNGTLRKIPAAIPNVTLLSFFNCYGTSTILFNNDLVKFYSSFPRSLASVAIDVCDVLSNEKVDAILESIGDNLVELELYISNADRNVQGIYGEPGQFEIIGSIHRHCKGLKRLTFVCSGEYWKWHGGDIAEHLDQLEESFGSGNLKLGLGVLYTDIGLRIGMRNYSQMANRLTTEENL